MPDPPELTLDEVAERLGVHYMTVYRYVRTGRLPAAKRGKTWAVAPGDLDRFLARPAPAERGRGGRSGTGDAVERLRDRLVAGDEPGAWTIVEEALAGGLEPDEVLLDLIGAALGAVGTGWSDGDLTVAEEHRATAVATRLIGRLGPRFARRGPSVGVVVLGAPSGDHHALPTAILRDLLRGRGYDVIDLGADVPAGSWSEAVSQVPVGSRLLVVGISVSTPGLADAVHAAVAEIRAATPAAVVLGGSCVPTGAQRPVVDHLTASARDALDAVQAAADVARG